MSTLGTSALIPGFYDPPHPELNRATESAENIAIKWLRQLDLVTTDAQEDHLRSFKFGLYHGMATPDIGLDQLVLGLKWFCWGSLADDQYDNYVGKNRKARMARVLRDLRAITNETEPPEGIRDPVVAGFADYWPELLAGAAPHLRNRITENFLSYLQAVAFQNDFHERGVVPDAATFLTLRRNTIAMVFQADVLEIICGITVPKPLRDSYQFRELVRCFADITAWHNDVYGLAKDLADGQTCNVVRVTAASEDCTFETAAARVVARAAGRQRLFLELEARLPGLARSLDLLPEAAEQAADLARRLRAYTHTNLVWAEKTRRYDLNRPRIEGTFGDLLTHQPTVQAGTP